MNHLPFSILLIATLLLFTSSFSVVDSIIATAPTAAAPAPSPIPSTLGCDDKCAKRCANAGYKERCLKYCGICCVKCQGCVPSSPYADKGECPCYRDLKNSKGKDKCP
ncbi:putative gibberellin regulated protein [Helianthus anomalus]